MTDDGDDYIVYCYDPSQDKWTTLPPLPVKWFGMGQVNGKLVAVGGCQKSDHRTSNELYTYDKRSRKWKQTIPPMPTARWFPGILSLQSALIVAGGRIEDPLGADNPISAAFRHYFSRLQIIPSQCVEVFKPDTSQWYRTDPLPKACHNISLVATGNTCYALGGYKSSPLNRALCASVDDLLGNAVPANQITHSGSSDTQSAWKTLPNTPTYRPAAAVLAGNLLAVGGTDEANQFIKREIYIYVALTNSWVYVGSLPSRHFSTAVILSPLELLVIAGSSAFTGTPLTFK